jgi:hypothetical protein
MFEDDLDTACFSGEYPKFLAVAGVVFLLTVSVPVT